MRITVPPPPPSIGDIRVDVDEDMATVTVTVANPSGGHTVYMRHRVGQSSWSQAQSQTTRDSATFTITGLSVGQDYTVQASLDDDQFASPTTASFATPKPGAEPLRESLVFVVSGDCGHSVSVDPLSFTLFGVDYAVESLAEEGGVVSMVLRGQCPAAYTVETLTIGTAELAPSQSCTDTNKLTLTADAQAGTLVDGSVLTLTVRSDHVTTADPSEGMGHRRGSIRDTICALPDTILGESACIPIMLFVPSAGGCRVRC